MFSSIMVVMAMFASPEVSTLHVNYDAQYTQMVEVGKYDHHFEEAHEKFWSADETGQKDIQISLFTFDREVTSGEVVKEMGKDGFRPATVKELLAFGAANPKCHLEGDTVALGSKYEVFGCEMVPMIFPNQRENNTHIYREVGQIPWNTKWPSEKEIPGIRFLGVKVK